MRIFSRLITWQHGHWRMNWVIVLCRAFCCPDELASPLVIAERYHVSQGFHHIGHVRNMISEVIRQADELGHLLLSRGLRKVKDLQSLLWGERGACRRDEVTDVFDPWETKRGLLGVESDVRSAKALEYLSDGAPLRICRA